MRFSIGTDDFRKLRTIKSETGQLCFYCDKSLLIKDIIDDGSEVIVLPRPRRFGKTLNLSMLKYFFDSTEDNTALFSDLKIAEHKNIMEQWQGKYPVVFISFKSLRSKNFEEFKKKLKVSIRDCYQNFEYLKTSPQLTELGKNQIKPYFSSNFDDVQFDNALKYLTEALEKHHGQKTMILIDEYDTPLQDAYVKGFFKDAIEPFRNMLGEVLKGNESIYKGIITGITRIAKESLFSGVNNLQVYDITDNRYAEYFGFTEEDIKLVCEPAHLSDLREWYNGYTFGDNLTIYNPWSVLNFLSKNYKFSPYWINASSNDIIKDSLTVDKLADVKALIDGQSLTVEIEPFTVMDNLRTNPNSFWNLCFMAGFLTWDKDKNLRIPNKEIQYFFEKIVLQWFGGGEEHDYFKEFLDALLGGDGDGVQSILSKIVDEAFSFMDVTKKKQESFYHGLLLGITLSLKKRYKVKSNRESGYGLYDIALFPKDLKKDPGVIIEIKIKGSADDAVEQIQTQRYTTDLKEEGCQIIYSYGMVFDKKKISTKMIVERLSH